MAADILLLLTDTAGLYTSDPRWDDAASLIEEVTEIDQTLEAMAGGSSSEVGSGGMASKLAAAKIARWSGVETVIADAARPGVVADALAGRAGTGTIILARSRRLPARKLWIAYAVGSAGTLVVDEGARRAVVEREASLLPAGVMAVKGTFDVNGAVELASEDGEVFAKGLVKHPSYLIARWAGLRSVDLPQGASHEVVHRDDMVVLR